MANSYYNKVTLNLLKVCDNSLTSPSAHQYTYQEAQITHLALQCTVLPQASYLPIALEPGYRVPVADYVTPLYCNCAHTLLLFASI